MDVRKASTSGILASNLEGVFQGSMTITSVRRGSISSTWSTVCQSLYPSETTGSLLRPEMDNIFDNKNMDTIFILVLLPYLIAKSFIVWGETVEFDDFPGSIPIGLSVALTYVLLILATWRQQYRLVIPLLAISASQLLAIKDGSYNAFLQSSVWAGIYLFGIFLERGLKADFTGLLCTALVVSTGVTFFQSL